MRDLKIDVVNHNDVAFLGNEFPVEVVFTGVKALDENAVISIYQGKNLLGKQQMRFDSEFQQSKICLCCAQMEQASSNTRQKFLPLIMSFQLKTMT